MEKGVKIMTDLTDKKEPTYYVYLTDYNEVKRMFLKANNDINKLKELLKECELWFDWYHIDTGTGKEYIESWHKKGHEIHQKINQALGEE